MSAHALDKTRDHSEAGIGLTTLRYLDLVALALALPLFLFAALPMLGYGAAAAAWLVQRGINAAATKKAKGTDDLRVVAGVLAGSMIGRGWIVAGSIFAVGMAGAREDGLAAALLSISFFTVYFAAQMVVRPFDQPGVAG